MKATCIRDGNEGKPCRGHNCRACDRVFYCYGEKHVCSPRPERVETGIERRQTFVERLSNGMKMLAWEEDSET